MRQHSLIFTVFAFVAWQPDAQAGPSSWCGAFPRSVKVVGYVRKAIEIKEWVEDATTKVCKSRIEAIVGSGRATAKLEVLSCQGEVKITECDHNRWLGDCRLTLAVPCTFRYTVDLAQLRSDQIRYDPSTRSVTIFLPRVQLEEPIPDREAVRTTEATKPFLRSKKSLTRLQTKALSEHLKPLAKEAGKERLTDASLAARSVLQSLFLKVYSPIGVDVRVVGE
jgi:hypothetical protein